MLHEIFHLEIFKKFHEIFEIFQDPFLNYFTKFLIFIIKSLKTFKNMIEVYIMLFMHNNRYLLTFNWFTYYFVLPEKTS